MLRAEPISDLKSRLRLIPRICNIGENSFTIGMPWQTQYFSRGKATRRPKKVAIS
jgi:hypothetical protein